MKKVFTPVPPGPQADLPFDLDAAPVTASHNAPRLSEWVPERWPLADDWRPVLDHFWASEAGHELGQFMRARLAAGAIIYPPQPLRALALTPLAQIKVVILGQDPYHGPGQAEGLAFSVAPGVRPPPSLRNIFKEIARDPSLQNRVLPSPDDGSLVRWARQGVLLLNTCLTVEEGRPGSHAQRGWESLTDLIVKTIAVREGCVAFLLWGAQAQAKQVLLAERGATGGRTQVNHLVLTANHPSPLSALRPPQPFLGCGHFGQANAFLQRCGCAPIAW